MTTITGKDPHAEAADAPVPHAHAVLRPGEWQDAADRVRLSYEERFLRRRRLATETGGAFVADLPETVSLDAGDAFELSDGRIVEVIPAEEEVVAVTGDLPRLAWHIGNRHTPCQIEPGRLVIARDHVLERMLEGLGAVLHHETRAFTPEGGAYGLGRTLPHHHAAIDEDPDGAAKGERHLHVHHHAAHDHGADEDELSPRKSNA